MLATQAVPNWKGRFVLVSSCCWADVGLLMVQVKGSGRHACLRAPVPACLRAPVHEVDGHQRRQERVGSARAKTAK